LQLGTRVRIELYKETVRLGKTKIKLDSDVNDNLLSIGNEKGYYQRPVSRDYQGKLG